MNLNEKIDKVKEILSNKKVALAFSGGADSTLLAYLAKEVNCDVLAISYDNGIFPNKFIEFTKKRANELNIKHEIIENNFFEIDEFVDNTPKRCLLCRKLMYSSIKQHAEHKGYEIIIDGNNITDLTHDRPGILMKYKYNIRSPFIEAKLETSEIHKFLNDNNIKFSTSTTCLATRIKTNEKVTSEKINRLDYCEEFIRNLTKDDGIRLRESTNIATIELENIENILDKTKIDSIHKELKLAQYNKVLLNLSSNSTEEIITEKELKIGESNYTLRKQLPFDIDINNTVKELENKTNKEIELIEIVPEIGYINLKINEKESKIFRDGKIVINNIKNKKEGKLNLIEILPFIRRSI